MAGTVDLGLGVGKLTCCGGCAGVGGGSEFSARSDPPLMPSSVLEGH